MFSCYKIFDERELVFKPTTTAIRNVVYERSKSNNDNEKSQQVNEEIDKQTDK